MKEKVIVIFDVGKTNKKLLLFNHDLNVIAEEETQFPFVMDEDGFECDNIDAIESWLKDSLQDLVHSGKYELSALNFATYGASLVYLGADGKRIGPVYNYLKPIDDRIPERVYKRYGGQDEFCRRTASPALGMLNSGMQILWLKTQKPEIYAKVRHILHFPQYLSYLFTGNVCSEHTSIGCHTALWDFDNMRYHPWVADNGINLPDPVNIGSMTDVMIDNVHVKTGIGIHDSSASLAPYFSADKDKFLLISTGTWCINMNPFNYEKLSVEQLDNDCLCYLSINQHPVKSSRIFLGNMHETAVKMLNTHFGTTDNFFKNVKYDQEMHEMLKLRYSGDRRAFFSSGPEARQFKSHIDLFDFKSFDEAYHQLMSELCCLNVEAVRLILSKADDTRNIYITGGFARNQLFLKMTAAAFPDKKIYTSSVSNASALGAAIVSTLAMTSAMPELNLNLTGYSA